MTDIVTLNEGLNPGSLVTLYEIDLNPVGINQHFYFQQADALGGEIIFGGNAYIPRPIMMEGFSRKGSEAPPEPAMTISNIDKGGYALLKDYNELLGAKVIRRRTYADFLDFLPDGVTVNPMADSSAQFIPEIWFIEQKETSNRIEIKFKLKSIMDLDGRKFPYRLVLKKVCTRRYRSFTGGTFKYDSTENGCPYAGANYFTRQGVPTTADLDNCGKDPGSCQLRFGKDLPGWFFPGVKRIPGNAR